MDWRFPAAPVGSENVSVPVPRTHVPAGTPAQLDRTTSAGGGTAPSPAIAQLIENLTADWNPEEFSDQYREALLEIVELPDE